MIKKTLGRDFIAVTPRICSIWDDMGTPDEKHVVTPAIAVKNGSDYLVIGRPIRPIKAF